MSRRHNPASHFFPIEISKNTLGYFLFLTPFQIIQDPSFQAVQICLCCLCLVRTRVRLSFHRQKLTPVWLKKTNGSGVKVPLGSSMLGQCRHTVFSLCDLITCGSHERRFTVTLCIGIHWRTMELFVLCLLIVILKYNRHFCIL